MNQININGKSFNVSGNNISVDGNTIIVDGKVIQGDLEGTVKIEFIGDLAKLDCTSCKISGDIIGNVDATRVDCANIAGDVDATTVKCDSIGGDVDATKITYK